MVHSKFLNLFISLVIISLLTSCLEVNDTSSIPNRISLEFNIENIGNEIVNGADTISVSEVKFLVDRFDLSTPTSDTLRLSGIDALIMSYNLQDQGTNKVILRANLGVSDLDTYDGIDFFIDQIGRDDNVFDRDLRTSSDLFSIVLKGTYNNQDFLYQSKFSFMRSFSFGPVEIGNNAETLVVRVFTDPIAFVTDPETREILSPFIESNSSTIDSLLQESLFIEASAQGSLPLN